MWGYEGPFRGPGDANAKSRSGPAPPGRFRALGGMGGHFVAPGTPTPNRGAARLRRGASERWGVWGPFRGPGDANAKSRSGPAPPGRFRALGGMGGHFDVTSVGHNHHACSIRGCHHPTGQKVALTRKAAPPRCFGGGVVVSICRDGPARPEVRLALRRWGDHAR